MAVFGIRNGPCDIIAGGGHRQTLCLITTQRPSASPAERLTGGVKDLESAIGWCQITVTDHVDADRFGRIVKVHPQPSILVEETNVFVREDVFSNRCAEALHRSNL